MLRQVWIPWLATVLGACTEGKNASMKNTLKRFASSVRLALVFVLVGSVSARGGKQGQDPPNRQQQPSPLIHSVEGPDLFRSYCASCHGLDARGMGPVAPALKAEVPDLTVLARNNKDQFPSARVRKMIQGDDRVDAHGSREMPVWGPIFHQVEADMDWGNVRLSNLVEYLQSIQISEAGATSGAALYTKHCAVCHGSDLKGSEPTPDPYRAPPDLTTLARRHNGKFPNAYVSKILRNGVVLPAHGPAEMPVWGTDLESGRLGEAEVTMRIANLVSFIRSLQIK